MSGSVLDSSGAVLPGATVTLTNQNTNQVQTTVSGDNGTFGIAQVPVGTYKVEIALQGFKTATYSGVVVAVGQEYSLTARLDARVGVGGSGSDRRIVARLDHHARGQRRRSCRSRCSRSRWPTGT